MKNLNKNKTQNKSHSSYYPSNKENTLNPQNLIEKLKLLYPEISYVNPQKLEQILTILTQTFNLNPLSRECIFKIFFNPQTKEYDLTVEISYLAFIKQAVKKGLCMGIKVNTGYENNELYAEVSINRKYWFHPITVKLFLKDFLNDPSLTPDEKELFQKMPITMLQKKAIIQAFSIAFPDLITFPLVLNSYTISEQNSKLYLHTQKPHNTETPNQQPIQPDTIQQQNIINKISSQLQEIPIFSSEKKLTAIILNLFRNYLENLNQYHLNDNFLYVTQNFKNYLKSHLSSIIKENFLQENNLYIAKIDNIKFYTVNSLIDYLFDKQKILVKLFTEFIFIKTDYNNLCKLPTIIKEDLLNTELKIN